MTAAPSCSGSRGASAPYWPGWLAAAPSLLAESLRGVQQPLAQWLRPGPVAEPRAVAATLAAALLPPEAGDAAPSWLRPDQRLSFARAVAAVRRYEGALLADGVGTGKTFIGLAVATTLEPGRPIHVLAPAVLLPQWQEAASRSGLVILGHSHETLSRGRPPEAQAGFVLLDESHRFRNPATRRYQALAPWCVGRRGLLLSATPVVNRLDDLSHQLLLLVREDALGWAGIPSLRALGAAGGPGAAAHLVVTGEDRSAQLPASITRDLRPEEEPGAPFEALRGGLLRLRLSPDRAISGLLRGGLLAGLASSPLALADALARYRSLLQHARDAAGAGRRLSRQVIRRIVGTEPDQLVLWPLVAEAMESPELALEDLPEVSRLEAVARTWGERADAKCAALRSVLSDGKPTLVFTTAVATVKYLRARLGRGTAWCTGQAAGLDALPAPREQVLDWFRRAALSTDAVLARPKLLLATDVAAEGLDLPLLERVVHYDLPWTAVRLTQRSGRAFRLGSRHRSVEIIRLLPPPELEAALRKEAILLAKAGLPERLGLGDTLDAPWRLRARVAAQWEGVAAAAGIAAISAARSGEVAGYRIGLVDGSSRGVVLVRNESGWSDDPVAIAGMLALARDATRIREPARAALRAVLRALALRARISLQAVHGERLAGGPRVPAVRCAIRRLLLLARLASGARDGARLALLERGLRLLQRGHTAGESRLAESLATQPVEALPACLARLPRQLGPPEVARVELLGVLVVERGRPGG